MWEDLVVYKQLDKKDINPVFKMFGKSILEHLQEYNLDQSNSMIKLWRHKNGLEQAVFIEKGKGSYDLKVTTSIKPDDFYKKHKFTMLNITPLGDIMNNHRRTHYPLTKEWSDLAVFLSLRIKNEIELYFQRYDTFDKIIEKRKEIEPKDFELYNKYELLIYAALKTRDKALAEKYINKKIDFSVTRISWNEYLKSDNQEINEVDFLKKIKELLINNDFDSIDREILMFL